MLSLLPFFEFRIITRDALECSDEEYVWQYTDAEMQQPAFDATSAAAKHCRRSLPLNDRGHDEVHAGEFRLRRVVDREHRLVEGRPIQQADCSQVVAPNVGDAEHSGSTPLLGFS